ncbi:xylulokinase [Lachnospiraceae bacterium LCP19S3_B12]
MDRDYIISIDIGTSSCKTALFYKDGTIAGMASQEHGTVFGAGHVVEQSPEEWWKRSVKTIRQVLGTTGVRPSQIGVIGIDSHSSSVIPVSAEGKALYSAMIWTDRRAIQEKEWIDREVGQEVLTQINGNRNDESNAACKILWLKRNCPSLYRDTYKILNASGYMVYRMTGKFSSNISEGGLSQLLDIEKGRWSKELIDACGLDLEKLPDIYHCYEIVGGITAEAADQTGLESGTPVVAGTMDAVACGLGCGITKKGDAYITGGTVTALGVCTDKPLKNGTVHVYHHIVPGAWCNMAGVDYGGGNYRWFRDTFMEHTDTGEAYETMNRMAESVPPGAEKLLFLPTTVGQRCPQWDGLMRGVFLGVAPVHTKAHFVRAIMEGNAFAVREIMELMEELGAEVKNLMIAGGIARSRIWMEIFENILERPLYVAKFEEATVLGNMLNAAYGVGLLEDFHKARDYCRFQELPPDQEQSEKYQRLFEVYKKMYPALKERFRELSELDI